MLQRTESIETSPTEASSLAPSTSEMRSAEAETLTGLDADLEEMAACTRARSERMRQRSRTNAKRSFFYSLIPVIVSMIYIIAWITKVTKPSLAVDGLIFFLAMVGAIAGLSGQRFQKVRTHGPELTAAKKLLQRDDVRVVAPLLNTSDWIFTTSERLAFWQALERLLPRMTEEEILQLGKSRHWLLAQWIQDWDSPPRQRKTFAGTAFIGGGNPVLVQLLRVMAIIGQSSIELKFGPGGPASVSAHLLPNLNRWAAGQGVGQDPKVQQAAILCREAIEQKMALARNGAQLLRASASTPAGSDTLLRPTQGTQQTDPQELLRPGDPK
jgi:hypothetical protein